MMKENKLLYKNKRISTMYFVMLVTILIPVFVYVMVFNNLAELRSEFKSTLNFLAFMVFVFTTSHTLVIIMLWMHQKYVLRIEQIDEHTIEVKTWSIIGLHGKNQYPREILNDSQFMAGNGFYGRGPVVNAPYYRLKTPTNKTLILDLQAEFHF